VDARGRVFSLSPNEAARSTYYRHLHITPAVSAADPRDARRAFALPHLSANRHAEGATARHASKEYNKHIAQFDGETYGGREGRTRWETRRHAVATRENGRRAFCPRDPPLT